MALCCEAEVNFKWSVLRLCCNFRDTFKARNTCVCVCAKPTSLWWKDNTYMGLCIVFPSKTCRFSAHTHVLCTCYTYVLNNIHHMERKSCVAYMGSWSATWWILFLNFFSSGNQTEEIKSPFGYILEGLAMCRQFFYTLWPFRIFYDHWVCLMAIWHIL
jgi:hypothetical protein